MRITVPIIFFIAATIISLALALGAVDIYGNPHIFTTLMAIGGVLVMIGWGTVIARVKMDAQE